jgi:hypothetical protein
MSASADKTTRYRHRPTGLEHPMTAFKSAWLATAAVLVLQCSVAADVLVLRDGRRIEGVLISVRSDVVEFEPRSGRDQGRVVRFDRSEVRTVDFDDRWSGNRSRDDDRYRDDPRVRPGMRERTVIVEARSPWTDAGVDIRGGQAIAFSASGETRWGPNRRDGAAGERNSPVNRARPMPERNSAALIGKIGENGDPFFIGDDREAIRVRGSGRLYLGINDDVLGDNSGSLRVVVSY